eukprot:2581040-Rhodomonas_salina.1
MLQSYASLRMSEMNSVRSGPYSSSMLPAKADATSDVNSLLDTRKLLSRAASSITLSAKGA